MLYNVHIDILLYSITAVFVCMYVCVMLLWDSLWRGTVIRVLELSLLLFAVYEFLDITLTRQKIDYKNIYAITKRLRGLQVIEIFRGQAMLEWIVAGLFLILWRWERQLTAQRD